MNAWFTADLHLSHAKIIGYCQRPFADVIEMDLAILTRWNLTVAAEDMVYVLGDFAFSRPQPWLDRLNGTKILVMGNHDQRWKSKLKKSTFARITDQACDVVDGLMVFMSHYPTTPVPPDVDIFLHGHSHGTLPNTKTMVDVGVDCWDFRPVSLAEIEQRANCA